MRARRVEDARAAPPEGRRQPQAQGQPRARHDGPHVVGVREVVGLDLGLVEDGARVEADAAPALGVERVRRDRVAGLQERPPPPQPLKLSGTLCIVGFDPSTVPSSHLRTMLPESSSRPLPAKRPNHAT